MNIRPLAAILLALFVTACQSGEDAPQLHPLQDFSAIRAAIPGEALDRTPEQIHEIFVQRASEANSVLSTDIVDDLGNVYASVVCDGAVCDIQGFKINLNEFDFPDTSFVPVMIRNGVPVAQGTAIGRFDSDTFYSQSLTYGGWTKYTSFYVDGTAYNLKFDQSPIDRVYAAAAVLGNATGTVATSGTATWKGVAVAGDLKNRNLHQGDATLTADFSNSNIDVELTNFYDLRTGSSQDSVTFLDVPFTDDGFARVSKEKMVKGKFYGPNHEETAGIFTSGRLFGAFGAIRN